MKKFFKSFAVILIAVCAAVACAFAVSACSKPTYTFIIQNADGTPVNGQTGGTEGGKVMTSICLTAEEGGGCSDIMYPDENGKLTLTQEEVNKIFEIYGKTEDVTKFLFHVSYVPGYDVTCEFEIDGAKEYICKLYKTN